MNRKRGKTLRQLTALALAITVVALLSIPPNEVKGAACVKTSRVFATRPGGMSIPISQFERRIAQLDVSPYRQIRITAGERVGSPTNVRIRLLTDGITLDVLELSPRSEVIRVYDVPGVTLDISVIALGPGTGSDTVDIIVYGNE